MSNQVQKQNNNTQPYNSIIANINIEEFLANNAKQFKSVMPKHFEMRTLFRLAVTEIRKKPDLMKCSTASLIGAMLECAQVGLEIGTGKSYLVPYYNKKTKVYECQFQVGYKGYIELALRTGKILKIQAINVFSNDHFYIEHGTNERLEHIPAYGSDRGEYSGTYAISKFKTESGNEFQFEYMDKDEIEAIRQRSPSASSDYSPWKTDYYEMTRKCPIKRMCKQLPSSTELELALNIDDKEILLERGVTFEADPEKASNKTSRVKQSLENKKADNILNDIVNQQVVNSEQPEMTESAQQFINDMDKAQKL